MTPLLLIPGMMCDARLFSPQIEAFSRQCAVMVAPLSGHDTVPALARDVLRDAPPRFALAGLSMGGIVAMEMMRQAPERIERLALMDTNPLPETDAVAAMRDDFIVRAGRGELAALMREELKPKYLADGPRKQAILDLCMAMARDLGADVFVRQSRALQTRPDQRETLKTVTIPALVLCGSHDTLCPVERHRLMHELIRGSELAIIEGAGHLPTLEQPADTNRVLAKWLS